jgi:hypothetical protein
MAPETLDDASLRELIKVNCNKKDLIVGAIENLWHGTVY